MDSTSDPSTTKREAPCSPQPTTTTPDKRGDRRMSISIEKEKHRLAQDKFLKWLNRQIRATEMVTVYQNDETDDHNIRINCALIPNDSIERSLNDSLHLGGGLPGAVEYHGDGEKQVKYLRFGNDDGVEPLVIYRDFHGLREDYQEISEEFRLFHRLYHDRKQDQYIKIDDSGNEHVIAVVEANRVQIRLLEIRQFLAIKEMHLAVMLDCREHSDVTLEELGLKKRTKETHERSCNGLLNYTLGYGDFEGLTKKRAYSLVLGKRLIPPLPKEKSGFWGFSQREPKKCVEFMLSQDDDGNPVTSASDPDRLGANAGQPNYLTPVHFRKQVLDKYYQQPSKYSVEDGYLRCGRLWGMTIDNHHQDHVVAWLGDLGRDLPYEEQLHWRSYNIALAGGVSATFFRRQLLAQFADSEQPEHLFKSRYQQLAEACEEKAGWMVLLPLSPDDAHYFDAVRVPASDEQKDFDDLVLALAKILVDSLNEQGMNKLIPASEHVDVKGSIARLEKTLIVQGIQGDDEHIKFLRNLQNLRSSGTAHRKGSNYQKIAGEFGVESRTLRNVFQGILSNAVALLEFLERVVQSGILAQTLEKGPKKNAP